MSRELAVASLAVGVVLALPAALFVAIYADPATALVVALCCLLPFATYAVYADSHPPTLLPPRGVLGGAALLAVLALGLALSQDAVAPGLLVCALAVGPALGYHGRYATEGLRMPVLVASGVLGVVALALVAVVADAPLAGSVAGASVGGATIWYLRERKLLTRRTRRGAAGVTLLGGAGVVVAGVVAQQAMLGLAGGMGLLVVGSALAVE